MRFRAFAQLLLQDWPNAWSYGTATLLLDRSILEECRQDHRATSLSRAAFLAHHTPEVTILLLGLQPEPKDKAEHGRASAVGLFLRPPSSNLSTEEPTKEKTWERVGLFIWSIVSERWEGEASRSDGPYELLAESLGSSKTLKTLVKDLPYLKGGGPDWK